jgi:hypothetical protein
MPGVQNMIVNRMNANYKNVVNPKIPWCQTQSIDAHKKLIDHGSFPPRTPSAKWNCYGVSSITFAGTSITTV